MIIRSTVVLALYHSLVFASPDAGPQYWRRSPYPSISIPSFITTSVLPTTTEQPLLLATNRSSKSTHSNSTHHLPANDTHHTTTPVPVRKPTPSRLPLPGQTVQPGPLRPSPDSGHTPHNSNQTSSKGPSIAQIFFEVIGGVAGVVVLLAVLRCIYIYRKTPANRCPPTPEVAEIDRTMALLRTVPWRPAPDRPPPPPYQPAPAYDAAIGDRTQEHDAQPPDRSQAPPEQV